MKLLSYLATLCCLEGLFLAGLALWLDRRSEKHWSIAAAGVIYAFWAFCYVFVYGATDPATVMTFYHLSYVGGLFVSPAMGWFYFVIAGYSVRFRVIVIGLVTAFSIFAYSQYIAHNFYYSGFEMGPLGNVGIISDYTFWPSFSAYVYNGLTLYMIFAMLQTRARARSFRIRRQSAVIATTLAITIVLYFGAWILEDNLHLPPLEVLVGGYVISVTFYLIGKYRYLRPDTPLLERQVGAIMKDALLILDEAGRIVSANPAAQQLFRQGEKDLVGRDFPTLFADDEPIRNEWQSLKNTGKVLEGLVTNLGNQVILISLSPNRDQFHDLIGAIAIINSLASIDAGAGDYGITDREKEVVLLLMQGYGTKAIAESLFISPGTVKNHIFNIYKKTGATNRMDLFSHFGPTKSIG